MSLDPFAQPFAPDHTTVLDRVGDRVVVRKQGQSPAARHRLSREAAVLARAQRPGVVELVSHHDDGHVSTLVTAWIGTHSLATATVRSLDQVAGLIAVLADTVEGLHLLGIIHGRITADHVVLDGQGYPVLIGLAEASLDGDPAKRHERPDDSSGLGRLLLRLLGALPPDQTRRSNRRRLAALTALATDATGEDRWARPSANRLAAGILAAVPSARPAEGSPDGPVPPIGGGGPVGPTPPTGPPAPPTAPVTPVAPVAPVAPSQPVVPVAPSRPAPPTLTFAGPPSAAVAAGSGDPGSGLPGMPDAPGLPNDDPYAAPAPAATPIVATDVPGAPSPAPPTAHPTLPKRAPGPDGAVQRPVDVPVTGPASAIQPPASRPSATVPPMPPMPPAGPAGPPPQPPALAAPDPTSAAGTPSPSPSPVLAGPVDTPSTRPVAHTIQLDRPARPPARPASDASPPVEGAGRGRRIALAVGAGVLIAVTAAGATFALTRPPDSGEALRTAAPPTTVIPTSGPPTTAAVPTTAVPTTAVPTTAVPTTIPAPTAPPRLTVVDTTGIVSHGGRRYRINRPDTGDPVGETSVGDFRCSGSEIVVALDPDTGAMWVFNGWSEAGSPLKVEPVTQLKPGSHLVPAPIDERGCASVIVRAPDGSQSGVVLPGPPAPTPARGPDRSTTPAQLAEGVRT